MQIDTAHLHAIAAVVREGAFDKAARALHITPSAVSQRIRALEDRLGTVLVVRSTPCRATAAGQHLCRHAEAVGLMEQHVLSAIGALDTKAQSMLRIAINADSLATWFVDAIALIDGVVLDVVFDNEDHSGQWLQRGEVCAAVSAAGAPIPGCRSRPLGALRYRATATPAFVARWLPEGATIDAMRAAPCLDFNTEDQLQARWLCAYVGDITPPVGHRLPSSNAFVDAAAAGIGWGMNPESLVRRYLADGRLVEIKPDCPLDVPLVWQTSRALDPALADVTQAVMAAARKHLVPGPVESPKDSP